MSDLFLYVVTVLIWGSTWFAITLQLGTVPPAVSVAWRFLAAAAILIGYSLLRGLPLRFSRREHLWMALQGLLLFCLNYVGFYISEQYLASGLVAVICSLLTAGNIIGMRVFFGVHTRPLNLLGALLGITGVIVLFWPELQTLSSGGKTTAGMAWAFGATICASLGNMAATRNQRRQMPVLQVNGWSMLYGALFTCLIAAIMGQRFTFEWSWRYVSALAYLAVFGSVLAFGAYLTLMKRIGAGRAGYAMVAIPAVALLISTVLENLQWTATLWTGVGLCLAGNVLVLRRDPAP